ncbi:reactivating factor for ethanolamine ammonia lyase [Salmonella enterica subsp. enterica]|uniref:Reactivating factor for ethanolamine ammonia lyase n=1 Tax=Salmonella enterica I TaxID=59201 RepID=A0A3S4I1W2_SALET|nr:reactivating factor for ethanolamine ammonia lyase [Salmonella enterica subsp. enterica]
MNTRQLLSVGIDIGTTTTQVIFSRLELVNRAAVSQVPRYEFIKRDISWQSPVFFTPVDKQGGLKEAELKALILAQYQAAGIAPESVDSGAIIITGESAKTPQRPSGGHGALAVAGRLCGRQRRAASGIGHCRSRRRSAKLV